MTVRQRVYLKPPAMLNPQDFKEGFKGNVRVRPEGIKFAYEQEHIDEYARCSDPETGLEYFMLKYVKVEQPDGQIVDFDPFPYQTRFAKAVNEGRFVLTLWARQSGKTTAAVAILLWHLLFKRNYNIVVAANKKEQAVEILDRMKLAIEWIPIWMQQGATVWRATKIAFENNSRIAAAATSSSGVRGKALSILYLDEFSHIHPNTQVKFYNSVYPAITAGKETKLIITTTPNGLDYFHKLWKESQDGVNGFQRVESHWSEKPGRDEAWAKAEIARLTESGFSQEYECVTGDAVVTVRDVVTGEVSEMKVRDLYDACVLENGIL